MHLAEKKTCAHTDAFMQVTLLGLLVELYCCALAASMMCFKIGYGACSDQNHTFIAVLLVHQVSFICIFNSLQNLVVCIW